MEAKVLKQFIANGKIQYTYNGDVVRTSKKDYKYALMAISRKHDDKTPFVVGLGNNPKTMKSSWASIYAHWCELFTIVIE